ncbi:MAG: hypothetical protein LC753_09425 [Acidobacteria bacterium]|nr:hypothetical protein [Acidobacteriota bacterium]MCA1650481.1 hypothetical protein [Acidobacteriota bacterium]
MRTLLIAVISAAALAPPALAQTADATGKWSMTLNTPRGPNTVPLVLKKEGETLTGTLTGPQGEELPIAGTQKDTAVSLSFTVQTSDGTIPVMMTGTQDGDAMKGTVDFGGRGTGDWSATREVAAAPPPADSATGTAVNVSGAWALEVNTGAGSGTPTATFTQEGDKLTGQYVGQFGEAPLTGTIKGNAITFSVTLTVQGNSATVIYTGTVDADTMKGTVQFGDLGEGTFTGKRKP